MNPTSSNPGMTDLLSPGPATPAPAQALGSDNVISTNQVQVIEFSELINVEVTRRSGMLLNEDGLQEGGDIADTRLQEGMLEGVLSNGKEMPVTAEFAAESSAEMDEAEAGLLFSMLGLGMAGETRPSGSGDRSGVPGLSAFSAAINSSLQGSTIVAESAPVQKMPSLRIGGGTEPRAPILDTLGYDPAPDPLTALQPFSAVARDTPVRDSIVTQPALLSAVAVVARGTEPPSASPDTFNLLTGMQSATLPPRLAPATVSAAPIDIPMGEPGWSKGIGERILWMVGKSIQTASIQINPRHLGPVDIQLNLQQDQASVSFSSPHAVVRDVLEAAIPRLREMFSDSSLQLVNVDVGQRGNEDGGALARQFRDQPMSQGNERTAAAGGTHSDTGEEPHLSRSGVLAGRGLLDDYA